MWLPPLWRLCARQAAPRPAVLTPPLWRRRLLPPCLARTPLRAAQARLARAACAHGAHSRAAPRPASNTHARGVGARALHPCPWHVFPYCACCPQGQRAAHEHPVPRGHRRAFPTCPPAPLLCTADAASNSSAAAARRLLLVPRGARARAQTHTVGRLPSLLLPPAHAAARATGCLVNPPPPALAPPVDRPARRCLLRRPRLRQAEVHPGLNSGFRLELPTAHRTFMLLPIPSWPFRIPPTPTRPNTRTLQRALGAVRVLARGTRPPPLHAARPPRPGSRAERSPAGPPAITHAQGPTARRAAGRLACAPRDPPPCVPQLLLLAPSLSLGRVFASPLIRSEK